ncbi:protein mab-21-like 3 [Diadema setosum]|uniref:protein mab-21-like 3 n=1 Tax=Diadema setosum TaxID=31175 RepID=UPI003B3A6E5D
MASKKKSHSKQSLSNALNGHIEYHVIPKQEEIKRIHFAILNRIIIPILNRVGEIDDRFRCDCDEYRGLKSLDGAHNLVGLNYRERYRVDIAVVLSNLLTSKCISNPDDERNLTVQQFSSAFLDSAACDNPYISSLPGFGYVLTDASKSLTHDLLSIKQDDVSSAQHESLDFANRSFLSPGKVIKRFLSLVEESIEILLAECVWEEEPTIYEISVKREGSLVRLHVILSGEEYTIDLVPVLELGGWWPKSIQAWGPPGAARPNQWLDYARMTRVKQKFYVSAARPPPGHDAFRLWSTCFFVSEKILSQSVVEEMDAQSSCRAAVLLAMRSLCEENQEDFHPITPRLVTIAFLHQCTQYPLEDDWAPHKLGRAFVDLFMALIAAVKAGVCSHYFLPSVNILDNSQDLKPVVHQLKAILSDIVENPQKTQFLHHERGRSDVSPSR